MPGYLIVPDEGRTVWLGQPGSSLGVTFKIGAEATGGAFSIVEHPVPPGALARPHTHTKEDEFSYVLEGEIGARIGDEVIQATAGCYVVKPRGIPHAFWNAGPRQARILEIISPAGFERYFVEMSRLLAHGGPPDLEAMGRLSNDYGLEYHPEWIPELVEKYGLKL
jgi:quercetin dioxygenase-like cupin family protein